MAHHGRHYSSGSLSPDPFSDRNTAYERYDPHDAGPDPIQMQNLSAYNSPDLRTPGLPIVSPPRSPPVGLSFPRGDNRQSYAPVRNSLAPNDSRPPSLYSVGSMTYHRSKDQHAQRILDRRAGEIAEWTVHWITPFLMVLLFLAGVAAAVGHHIFYTSLENKVADKQLLMVRYGTALAFFVKSALVGSIVMGYKQRIWHTFRTRALTVRGIDGLFSATEDPTQFLYNGEMMRNGKIATLMALGSWLIPLASVLSPGSLTSAMTTHQTPEICPQVATVNFTREELSDWRSVTEYQGSSLVYYNTTSREPVDGSFDYYDRPSQNARRLVYATMYLKEPVVAPKAEASSLSCGDGFNCTYDISFEGPGYKCDLFADDDHPGEGDSPFGLEKLAPRDSNIYYAIVDQGDYKMPQTETGQYGIPIKQPYPDSLGVFDVEPILWIGYSQKRKDANYTEGSPERKKGWIEVQVPKIYKCVAHYTKYTFQLRYNDTRQSYFRKERDYLRPFIDTTIKVDEKDGNKWTASPESNFVSPKGDGRAYKRTSSYHALMQLLRDFLGGSISWHPGRLNDPSDPGLFVSGSDISETRLMDAQTTYPVKDLMDEIQNTMEDILISLLSDKNLVVAQKQAVPCELSRAVNVYVYRREGLWVGYAFAVAGALVCLFIGGWAIHQNGVSSDTLFSRILVTTRNPTLDRLSVGACLGGDPFPKELTKTKLRFGVLLEDDPREGPLGKVEHCTFGAEGETKDIVKNGVYAGLKQYRDEPADEEWDEKTPLLVETEENKKEK